MIRIILWGVLPCLLFCSMELFRKARPLQRRSTINNDIFTCEYVCFSTNHVYSFCKSGKITALKLLALQIQCHERITLSPELNDAAYFWKLIKSVKINALKCDLLTIWNIITADHCIQIVQVIFPMWQRSRITVLAHILDSILERWLIDWSWKMQWLNLFQLFMLLALYKKILHETLWAQTVILR